MNTLQKQFPIKTIKIKASFRATLIGLGVLTQLTGCAMIGLDMGSDHPVSSGMDRSPAGWSSDTPTDSGYNSSNSGSNTSNGEDAKNEREHYRRQAIMNQDILLGMSAKDVQSAWGTPRDIETAGFPGSGNERWVYYNGNSTNYGVDRPRIVYFEQGHVVGWESANR
jgi:hypothetical protein